MDTTVTTHMVGTPIKGDFLGGSKDPVGKIR